MGAVGSLCLSGCLDPFDFEESSFLGFASAELGIDSTDNRGVCVFDADQDGDHDLLITRAEGPHLWINLGDGLFDEQGVHRYHERPANESLIMQNRTKDLGLFLQDHSWQIEPGPGDRE